MPRSPQRYHRILSASGLAILLILHLDVWRVQRDVLWFGWLPEELGFRLLWMIGAMLFVMHFTGWLWVVDGEDAEGEGGARRP